MLEPGDFLFKLAAKSRVKELQELIQGNREAPIDVPKTVEDIVKISVRYQILSGETAFIGVIKQDSKVIGEIKKVVIPTTMSSNEEDALGGLAASGGTRWGGAPLRSAGGGMIRSRCAVASGTSSSSYGNTFKGAVKKSMMSAMPRASQPQQYLSAKPSSSSLTLEGSSMSTSKP